MKVVFCTEDHAGYVGGPNAWLKRLLPYLKKEGLEPVVFVYNTKNQRDLPTVGFFKSQDIPCRIAPHFDRLEQLVGWTLQQFKKDGGGVFLPNFTIGAYYASAWIREAGIPTVAIIHSDDHYHRGLIKQFVGGDERFRVSHVACVSKFLAEDVSLHAGDRTGVRYLPYGAPLPEKTAVHNGPGELQVAFVGRLVDEQKRAGTTLRAFAGAAAGLGSCRFAVYGHGESIHDLEDLLARRPGTPISYQGRVDSEKIQEEMARHQVVALLSDYEGLPISLMEAMACGLVPVCLHMRSGIPELIQDGVNGFIVGNRGEEFVSALGKLKDEGRWKAMSAAARKTIEDHYSHDTCSGNWARFIREILPPEARAEEIRMPETISCPEAVPELKPYDLSREVRQETSFDVVSESIATDEYLRERLSPRAGDSLYLHLADLKLAMELVATQEACRILDYGCGCSPYRTLFPNAQYLRADYMKTADMDLAIHETGTVDLPDAGIDLLLSTQVAEHLSDPMASFREMARLVGPGKKAFVTTHGMFGDHPCPFDFQRWTPDGLARDLTQAGFKEVVVYKTTNGPRALAFMLELYLKSMVTPSLSPFSLLSRGLEWLVRVRRPQFHRYLDRHFKDQRLVTTQAWDFSPYIGLAALATK